MQPGCVSARGGGRVIASAGAALLLAAAIAGCGGHGAGASAANAGTLAPASGTSGCGHHEASGSLQYTLTVSGHRRTVIVHIPAGYTGKRKLALVLNLHGSESTASAQEKFSGMDATADADHFIVAYPQALIADGIGYDWNIPGEPMVNGKYPPASAPSDVTFLTTLVRDLAGRYCVDLSRVYATGVSGGGRMASQLACDASSVFAAIAPVAGLRYPSPCPASRPVPVIAFHGTADHIDPFNGHRPRLLDLFGPDGRAPVGQSRPLRREPADHLRARLSADPLRRLLRRRRGRAVRDHRRRPRMARRPGDALGHHQRARPAERRGQRQRADVGLLPRALAELAEPPDPARHSRISNSARRRGAHERDERLINYKDKSHRQVPKAPLKNPQAVSTLFDRGYSDPCDAASAEPANGGMAAAVVSPRCVGNGNGATDMAFNRP